MAFRALSCDSHPDHSRISDFRKRQLAAISRLFVQVLGICKEAGGVCPDLPRSYLTGAFVQVSAPVR
ncbi:MAG: hypothetical protein FJ118_09210 [Deltaproteobacteria bacterium]|nr:hypothetical protein [Deltaproteobacteria bacterium]